MIIGSCGYGCTGASPLIDLLSEYEDIQIFEDFEFVYAYRVDGLQDLEYHLMKQYAKGASGDYAIKRFLEWSKSYNTPFITKPCDGKLFYDISKKFIDNIIQIRFKGVETADMYTGNIFRNITAFFMKKIFMPCITDRISKKPSYLWPCRFLNYSIEPENFYEEAKKYTNNILKAMGVDLNKVICLDQLFEGNSPENSFPFLKTHTQLLLIEIPGIYI